MAIYFDLCLVDDIDELVAAILHVQTFTYTDSSLVRLE